MALSHGDRRALLAIARGSIADALGEAEAGARPARSDWPALPSRGAFVTLHGPDGALRGCIGTFAHGPSLAEAVHDMARQAAFADPRFDPVEPGELAGLTLDISVLGPVEPLASADELEIGRHGLVVERGARRGVLLPQVAVEGGFDRPTFLAQTCRKAGLVADAWRDPETRLGVFEAELFSEKDGDVGTA